MITRNCKTKSKKNSFVGLDIDPYFVLFMAFVLNTQRCHLVFLPLSGCNYIDFRLLGRHMHTLKCTKISSLTIISILNTHQVTWYKYSMSNHVLLT